MRVVKSDRWLNKNDTRSQPLMTGERNHFYGKQHSEETRIIIGNKSKGRKHTIDFKNRKSDLWTGEGNPFSQSNRTGDRNPMFGKLHSEETKSKMRLRKKCNPPSGDKNSMYGKKQPTATCQYCGKVASKTNILRWHGENCKEKKK